MYVVESLKYPLKDVKALIIGSLVALFSMLVIPAFFLKGYLIRIMGATVRKEDKVPEWKNWGELFMKGLGYLAISLVYVIILLVILLPPILGGALLVQALGMEDLYALALIPLVILIGIPAALYLQLPPVRYAETGRVGSAFEFRTIYGNLRRGFKTYLLDSIGIWAALIAVWIAVFLLCLVLVGFLLIPVIEYYSSAVQARLYARIYTQYM
ncbi:MAG: DUF4013 domain-containing protein [Candidatus Altiarchaeota archaeon]|nr:DUF4013 domain-containing protein [Candidatus Altiarchaeota archaeon]